MQRRLKIIKIIIIVALGAMIVIDLILVVSKEYPTFSQIFLKHRTELIWFNFLYGGLMTKIFFNRKVKEKHWEFSGFLSFMVIVVMLFVLGQNMEIHMNTPYQIMFLICGAILAYRVWPQYSPTA